jgi:hypothetical protein
MLRVCCFCDKIHDDAGGLWRERRGFAPDASREAAILSYTCCHRCFEADPRATSFRARQAEASASPYPNHSSVRGSGSARSWRQSTWRAAS